MYTHRNQRIAIRAIRSPVSLCGKLGMGDEFPRNRNELWVALDSGLSPLLRSGKCCTPLPDRMQYTVMIRNVHYILVYPNQLLRLLDLDPIRLKFQEIVPCGKTRSPNHNNYQRLQVPPKPWLLWKFKPELLSPDPSASSLRRVFGVPLLAKSKRSGCMMKTRPNIKGKYPTKTKILNWNPSSTKFANGLATTIHVPLPAPRGAPFAEPQACAPSLPMRLPSKLMFVRVVLIFSASARASGQKRWQAGRLAMQSTKTLATQVELFSMSRWVPTRNSSIKVRWC